MKVTMSDVRLHAAPLTLLVVALAGCTVAPEAEPEARLLQHLERRHP